MQTIKGMLEPIHDAWLDQKSVKLSELDKEVLAKLIFRNAFRALGPWVEDDLNRGTYYRDSVESGTMVLIREYSVGVHIVTLYLGHSESSEVYYGTIDVVKKACDRILRDIGYYLLEKV